MTLTADGKRLAFLKGRIQLDVYVGELDSHGSKLALLGDMNSNPIETSV